MINKEYWDKFYALNIAPIKESAFAEFVLNYLKENNLTENRLVDVACGNGRDTFYFMRNNIDSVGVDLSVQPSKSPNFIQDDILTFDYSPYKLIYLRFIVHALTEIEFSTLLTQIKNTSPDSVLFIETRSSKGITNEDKSETYFKSSIGTEHFRMLYSCEYLLKKLEANFQINYVLEDNGLSVYKEDDPVCIRMLAKA